MSDAQPLDFDCPFCQQNLNAPPELFGQTLACPSCSNSFVVPTPGLPDPVQYLTPNLPPPSVRTKAETSGLAIASLICGILGFFTGITAIAGAVLGHLSLAKIKKSNGILGGRRLAVWGLMASYLSILATLTFGIAKHSLASTARTAKLGHAESDFQTYKSGLTIYKLNAGAFPSLEQGLQALVSKPTMEPVPKRWTKVMNTLPVDPWGNAYGYRINGGDFEVTSSGPDSVDDSRDDLSLKVGAADTVSVEQGSLDSKGPRYPFKKKEPLKAAPKAKDIYDKSGEEAIAEARRFMVGTWIYTGQEVQEMGSIWIKWVIKEDGTMEDYWAEPIADGWGEPRIQEWEIVTAKYSNTGKRYYALQIKGQVVRALIGSDGDVQYRLGETSLPLKRGDAFPFSK